MDILIAIAAVLALVCGLVTFLVVRADFGRNRATAIGAGIGLVVGLSFFGILYLAVGAFLAAVVAYLVMRRLVSVRAAVVTGAAALVAGALASAALLSAALTTM
ncbi:hypothetical protein [Couchioplanes caeruleus]|uniref:hypothetical protein n=1 Tax=Couchioplanes caeruleus TaxID=56438 RepID=UPI00116047C9|nr:hypothetical protein [Couchioplanes caeruleus]